MTRVIEVFIPKEAFYYAEKWFMQNYVLREYGIECSGSTSCTPKGVLEIEEDFLKWGFHVRQTLED